MGEAWIRYTKPSLGWKILLLGGAFLLLVGGGFNATTLKATDVVGAGSTEKITVPITDYPLADEDWTRAGFSKADVIFLLRQGGDNG